MKPGCLLLLCVSSAMIWLPGCEPPSGPMPPGVIACTRRGAPSDPVNVVLVGTERDVKQAMKSAGWVPPDQLNFLSGFGTFVSVTFFIPYPRAPMTRLYLWNRQQDLAFLRPGWSAHWRHHVRLWQAPFPASGGRPVWLAAALYDNGVSMNGQCLYPHHSVDPNVGAERDRLVADLQKAGKVAYVRPLTGLPVIEKGHTSTGDKYFTDGAVLLAFLVPADAQGKGPAVDPASADQVAAGVTTLYNHPPVAGSAAKNSAKTASTRPAGNGVHY